MYENPEKNPDHPNLNVGGTNKGGTGRPSSEIRERCRGSFIERIIVLEEIADNEESRDNDRIKAVDLLGKYGIGTKIEIDIPNAHFASMAVQVALEFIDPDRWDDFKAKMTQVLGGDN